MVAPRVYLETSVVSYLTGRPSRDLVTLGRQHLTREWWDQRRSAFRLFISQFVVTEAAAGDPEAARGRLAALEHLPLVILTQETRNLARALIGEGSIPPKAAVDAFHIASAVSGGADFLLTWNFRHLANASLRKGIETVCVSSGYQPPTICTPEELMG